MMRLDTSFLIRALHDGTSEASSLDHWIGSGEIVGIDSVAWCEFLCGPVQPRDAALALSILGPPISFINEDSTVAAPLFNATGRRRGSLIDCMIAAVAVRLAARIATNNTADFRRFEPYGVVLAAG